MRADKVASLTDTLARPLGGLLKITANVLGIGDDAVINPKIRIARTQPDSAASRFVALLPATGIGER